MGYGILIQKAGSILSTQNLQEQLKVRYFYVFKWRVVEARPHSGAEAHLELGAILLSQPPM